MSEPNVTLDPASLPAATRHLHDPLEEQLTSAMQAATARIRQDYAGEPVEQVCRRLLDETRSGLHPDIAAAFQPDMTEFCRIAVAIVRGTPP
ncbi:hypothetical protein O7632_16460 [Solwaraspora sp. WMMD406]|uniref:hypothetical protein n=1 Tax=Solwaraspora sp. WMMD406 TaxID=3016095 RepID=UPI0024161507|nr:hypothetical protein [Solwaraspora sp. WMMD406]MDG4765678.1 hypothetical protein [Solwaraspora sp. WMMD406]